MLFAIGDVHGHFDKLMALMRHCRDHAGQRGEDARFILLGDYIDRGPASNEVLEFLSGHPANVVALRGNHEDLMLRALNHPEEAGRWHNNGGLETLDSYRTTTGGKVPAEHIKLVESLPLAIDDGLRLFVHAGIDPLDPDARNPDVLLWTRTHPADDAALPRFIVHGHTPTRDRKPDLRPNRLNLDTGAGWGHALTAAGFEDGLAVPQCFIRHDGMLQPAVAHGASGT
jgi:serine/threonine protein phosphatase 1